MNWNYNDEYDKFIRLKEKVQKRKKKDLMIFIENKVTCIV